VKFPNFPNTVSTYSTNFTLPVQGNLCGCVWHDEISWQ